jgi:alkylation response protein AidB-like acyl-CoA dehydrogenase
MRLAEKFVSNRNIKFLLYEVFEAPFFTKYPFYQGYDQQTFDMILETAMKLAKGLLWPNFLEMDRKPPELVGEHIKAHPSLKTIMKAYGEGGWIGATVHEERGGQQMPHLIADSCLFLFAAANYSASALALLSTGAAHLIELFGTQYLLDNYLPKLLGGQWQGTMAMTEPEAGSSLADLSTRAEPIDNGTYKIVGQKCFISAGDHDGVDNVVHMLLARIKGAPPGVKGISLFLVPQKRVNEDGSLTWNDVTTSGIFHKLGYRGNPLTQLNFGEKNDCRGYLIGEPHQGLSYMFQMMNEERIGVGIGATGGATAAYYAALEYARERRQGRKPTEKDPTKPQVLIIEHADVKRLLLFQRAVIEGSLSLLLQCSQYVDFQAVADGEEKEKVSLLLDLLTPIAKTYPSEMGILSISAGLQCFGGSGFCDDYPLELYYRDARIHPIHEGTTGIHGIDLLGRKVIRQNGKAFQLFLVEVEKVIGEARKYQGLEIYAQGLSGALEKLKSVTEHLVGSVKGKGPEHFLADATLYLELFSIIAIAWQWLLQAIVISKALEKDLSEKEKAFYQGKLYPFRYFFGYELPKIEGLLSRLWNNDGLTVEVTEELFAD